MVQRRNTHQRQLVFDAVQALAGCHPTASEIYQHVHSEDERVSLGTVYRNLNLLSDEGKILAVKAPDGFHYDWRTDAHSHVVCVACGSMKDTILPYESELDEQLEKASGYKIQSHYTVFEGLCAHCR